MVNKNIDIGIIVLLIAISLLYLYSYSYPPLQNKGVKQETKEVTYIGSILAIVKDCAPFAEDCKPETYFYLSVNGNTFLLDLENATIQVPLHEYVGVPDKKVKVIGILENSTIKAILITTP